MKLKTWRQQHKAIPYTDIVAATVLEHDPAWLEIHGEYELTAREQQKMDAAAVNLQNGMPLGYVLGVVEFYNTKLMVRPEVLIPRPETEQVVDLVLETARQIEHKQPLKIVDIGTGSGCIAIALKKQLPDAEIYATDISLEALKVAARNAELNNVEVCLLRPTNLMRDFNPARSYDIIVANLPYVDRDWEWLDQQRLGYEPEIALYAKDGGLALIKKLIDQVTKRKIDKYLVLEADPSQHQAITKYAKSKGLKYLKSAGYGLLFGVFA